MIMNSSIFDADFIKNVVSQNSAFVYVMYALVTQPMLQLRPNCMELTSMDYYHQFFCRFRKRKRKVPPPSLLSNDFEKSCFSSAIFSNDFFSKLTFLNSRWHFSKSLLRGDSGGTFRLHFRNLQKIWW